MYSLKSCLSRGVKVVIQCFEKDISASVFNENTKFNKQWIDLMSYYFVFLLLGNMNVF